MNWPVVLSTSLIYATIFAVCFSLILGGGALVARDVMVQDYPPAIRERYGPKSAKGERAGRVMAVLLLAPVVGVTAGGIATLRDRLGGDIGFWPGFTFGVTVFIVLHLFDLVVIDWLLFCWIQPRFMVLPGTEGMPEYRDWLFHLKVLVPRPVPWPLLLVPGYGLVVGGATLVVEAL